MKNCKVLFYSSKYHVWVCNLIYGYMMIEQKDLYIVLLCFQKIKKLFFIKVLTFNFEYDIVISDKGDN